MINRKFMAIALPLVTFATLVGSGFAAWHFEEQTVTPYAGSVGVQVTEKAGNVGAFTVDLTGATSGGVAQESVTSANFKMFLDQGQGLAAKEDQSVGISFKYNGSGVTFANGTDVTNVKSTYAIASSDLTALTNAGLKPVLTATFTINGFSDFDTYLATPEAAIFDVDGTASTISSGAGTKVYTVTKDVAATSTVVTLNTTGWKYKAKPTTVDNYNLMVTAMKNVNFTLNYSVTIADI